MPHQDFFYYDPLEQTEEIDVTAQMDGFGWRAPSRSGLCRRLCRTIRTRCSTTPSRFRQTGTVTDFRLPQSARVVYIDVQETGGKKVNYWFEMSNVPNMIRRGIGHTTFKPGDKVTVNFHPLKDGRAGGNYVSLVFNGKTFD